MYPKSNFIKAKKRLFIVKSEKCTALLKLRVAEGIWKARAIGRREEAAGLGESVAAASAWP